MQISSMQRPRGPRPGLPQGNTFASSSSLQTNIEQNPEKLRFGNVELLVFPNSNISFKILSHISVTRTEKCLLDNLWIAYNKPQKDQKYFLACLNALSEYFSRDQRKFKCYVVLKGKHPGIYHTWLEVSDCIKNFPDPLYKGFYSFSEALDACRKHLGINYFISPSLKNNPDQELDFSVKFCNHCETMTRNFKILNESNQTLQKERLDLQKKVSILEQEILMLRMAQSEFQAQKAQTGTIEPKKSMASPDQTVSGKDLSNPLLVLGLPKAQQTQEAVDPLTRNKTKQIDSPIRKEIWDTLGQPSGKFDYLVRYDIQETDNQTQQAENPVTDPKLIEDQTQQTGNSVTRLISPTDLKQKSPMIDPSLINSPGHISENSAQDPNKFTQSDIEKIAKIFERIEELKQQQVKQKGKKKKKLLKIKKKKDKIRLEDFMENSSEGDNGEGNSDSGASLDTIGQHNYETR